MYVHMCMSLSPCTYIYCIGLYVSVCMNSHYDKFWHGLISLNSRPSRRGGGVGGNEWGFPHNAKT